MATRSPGPVRPRNLTQQRPLAVPEGYRRVMRRRGDAKAIVALGHEILLAPYCALTTAQPYNNPAPPP